MSASERLAALGLTVLGRDEVSGEWADTAVGLDGNHARIAMLQTPDGGGRLELFEYIHPAAIETGLLGVGVLFVGHIGLRFRALRGAPPSRKRRARPDEVPAESELCPDFSCRG